MQEQWGRRREWVDHVMMREYAWSPEKGASILLKGEASLWEVVGVVTQPHLIVCHWLSGTSVALSNQTLAKQKGKCMDAAYLHDQTNLAF